MLPTGGDWDVQLLSAPGCCQPDGTSLDIILVSTIMKRRGTLRRLLFGGYPKVHLKGATVYVARVDPDGRTQMARPCEDCWLKLRSFGIKEVIYTIGNGRYVIERI